MKRLTLLASCLLLLTARGLAQRDETQERRPPTGVITAPGGHVVVAPRDPSEASAAAPCADAAPIRVALVIRGVANLRDRANIAGAVVGEVRKGGALVIEREDGPGSPWYEVTDVASGRRGWVHGNVIRVAYQR